MARVGRRHDRGQATVEFALALPLVALVLLGIVQVVVVIRGQLAVDLAAREGARAAAVSADPSSSARRAAESATRLRPLDVATETTGATVRVTVTYTDSTDVALVGRLVGDVTVTATATMAREPP